MELKASDFRCDKVTRLEVINEQGRLLVKYDVHVELQLQDDERTLKVFIKDKKKKQDETSIYGTIPA